MPRATFTRAFPTRTYPRKIPRFIHLFTAGVGVPYHVIRISELPGAVLYDESVTNLLREMNLQSAGHTYTLPFEQNGGRLSSGERTLIVLSPKVTQRSYGTELLMIHPPPTAIMIGNSWWTEVARRGEEPKLCPPRVIISLSGEAPPLEPSIEWLASSGESFDVRDPPTGTTYIGRSIGRALFVSDFDIKKVEALVKVTAPATDDAPERVLGTFASRPIKVITALTRWRRRWGKTFGPCITHGSTISLSHRLGSRTGPKRYLCASGSDASSFPPFTGSDGDGAPFTGFDPRSMAPTPSLKLSAQMARWDPFIIYVVDVDQNEQAIDIDAPPFAHRDFPYPPPPQNAIPFVDSHNDNGNGAPTLIYYNQTVVLQCLASGAVSPVLIIREVEVEDEVEHRPTVAEGDSGGSGRRRRTVVGGGLQDGEDVGTEGHYCAPGESRGGVVLEQHRIVFEVYTARTAPSAGTSRAFLVPVGEDQEVGLVDGRQWIKTGASMSVPWETYRDVENALTWTIAGTNQVQYHLPPEPAMTRNQNEDENENAAVLVPLARL